MIIDGESQPGYGFLGNLNPLIELSGLHAPAGSDGLKIVAGSSTVQGLAINGFGGAGIELAGAGGDSVLANYIGTDPTGKLARPNSIGVYVNGATSNAIGRASTGNLISGNSTYGVYLEGSGAPGNTVYGNTIGLNSSGGAALPNGVGVDIDAAAGNTLANDTVSGNLREGVYIQNGASGNVVAGSFLGTDSLGARAFGNGRAGVHIEGAPGNTVGGTTSGARNVISGNRSGGVEIELGSATGNVVEGNYIGTDASGALPLGNSSGGVAIEGGAAGNVIGGAQAAARNIISANAWGVSVDPFSASNWIEGNTIGLDVSGRSALGNTSDGVGLSGSHNFVDLNTISGNVGAGVAIDGGQGNSVTRNRIGTDAAGTRAVGNGYGVFISFAGSGNVIGGVTFARFPYFHAIPQGNVISGNHNNGVELDWATGNQVLANLIGTQADGISPLGNGGHGVLLTAGSNNNQIGSLGNVLVPSEGNTIAYNGGDGVFVESGIGNAILSNSIYANAGKGIGLDADFSPGGNNLQRAPTVFAAYSSTSVLGTPNSIGWYLSGLAANTTYTVQLFDGGGKGYLGTVTITTDSHGNTPVQWFVSSVPLPRGDWITATATDPLGNTSEFAAGTAAQDFYL